MRSATVSSSLPRRYVYLYCGGAIVTGSVLLGCPAPRPVAGRTRPSTTCAVGLGSASLRRHIPSPTAPVCVAPFGRAAAAVYVFRPLDIAAVLSLRVPSSWAVLSRGLWPVAHDRPQRALAGWEAPPYVGTFPARQRPFASLPTVAPRPLFTYSVLFLPRCSEFLITPSQLVP